MPFLHSLSDQEIANQLSALLNGHNQLGTQKSAATMLSSRVEYIVETHGQNVIGAVGLDRQSYSLSEIKHLVVTPNWRKKGIAQYLVKKAIQRSTTPLVYATVREDNPASLGLFEKMGFARSISYTVGDHQVVLLTKVNEKWKKEPQFLFASPLGHVPIFPSPVK